MKQTKKASFVESIINVVVGFGIALTSQIIVFPFFGVHLPFHDNLMITIVFTFISIARSFCLRRVFETMRVNGLLP